MEDKKLSTKLIIHLHVKKENYNHKKDCECSICKALNGYIRDSREKETKSSFVSSSKISSSPEGE